MFFFSKIVSILIACIISLLSVKADTGEDPYEPSRVSCYYAPSSNSALDTNIIPIEEKKSLNDDSVTQIKFRFEDKEMEISLKQYTGLLVQKNTPVWTVRRNPKDKKKPLYELQRNALDGIEAYSDEDSRASFSVLTDKEGQRHYSGIFDYKFGFKSAPGGSRKRRYVPENNSTILTMDNIFYKMPDFANLSSHSPDFNPISHSRQKRFFNDIRNKIPLPEAIYPEILVIMDYKLFKYYRKNLKAALSYIITFWNAVDLKYRDFTEPKVRLHISGIVIEKQPGVILPLTMLRNERNKLTGKLDGDNVLDEIGQHLYNYSNLIVGQDFDMALLMTGNDLTNYLTFEKPEERALYGLIGLAYLGSACSLRRNQVLSVGLFEDTNGYIGVIHAAHELAHILGALHDGHYWLDYPGENRCEPTPEDDYIMSTLRIDGKHFSKCSKLAVQAFAQYSKSICLQNYPNVSNTEILFVPLPGKILSLDKQCQSAGYVKAYNTNESVCEALYCIGKNFNGDLTNTTHIPAVEGSSCGAGGVCTNGTCVNSKEEKVTKEEKKEERKEVHADGYFRINNLDRRLYIG